MKHLLRNWDEFKDLFMSPVFLMSDYDGTLTPIVDRPKDAVISDEMRRRISRLVGFCPVGIISGRSLGDIKFRVGVEDVYYSGNHGFRISGPDVEFVKEEADRAKPVIRKICERIERRLGSMEGVIVEDKDLTASIHYRLVEEEDVPRVERIVREETEPYRRDDMVEINHGKKVLEIGPRLDWDKGKAISLLLRVVGLEEDTMPVYLGDDVTDEDAFFQLRERGVGVFVSEEERESAADFILNGVEEVGTFLDMLLDLFASKYEI